MQKRPQDFLDDLTQIDEDENESSKNVYSNMKKLGNSQYFSNPSRLQKQKIPDFEPRPNDLNALVSTQTLSSQVYRSIGAIQFPGSMTSTNDIASQKMNLQQFNRNGSQPSIYQINHFQPSQQHSVSSLESGNNYKQLLNQQSRHHNNHQHHHHYQSGGGGGGYAEENINDNDFSSSEFDVSENEAIGPSHNINQSILNQYKNTFFNQKIKEFNERKARCHTLLPKQAQKYFRDHKTTKSYIQHSPLKLNDDSDSFVNIKGGGSTKRIPDNSIDEFQEQNYGGKPSRNKSAMVQRVTSHDNINNAKIKNGIVYDEIISKKSLVASDLKLLQQQDKFQNQIAQQLPQSVLDANKFNLNFNNQQLSNSIQSQQRKQSSHAQSINSSKELQNKNTNSSPINGVNKQQLQQQQQQQQHNIPNPQMKTSPNELSKLLQGNNTPSSAQSGINLQPSQSSTATSSFSAQIGVNRPASFSNTIHKQVKDEVIQKQIVKSQQIQAKLEEQSKNIEEKKALFQDQILKKVNGIQIQTNNQIQTLNNVQVNNTTQNLYTQNKISSQAISAPQSTKQIQQSNQYNKQSSTSTDKNLAPSKISSLVSPHLKQEQMSQDVDSLNVRFSNNPAQNNLGSSNSDLPLDAQSRSSVSQKQAFEKQSSYKMQQLQNNFQTSQFLQTNDPNRKSKRSLANDHDLLGFPENETFVGTINTIDVRVDTQTIKTNKAVDKKEQSRLIDSELYDSLIRSIFASNIQLIESTLKRIVNEERYHLINQIDDKGNTPLLLAVKLAYSNPNYYTIVKMLLKHDADPRIRDKQDWSCFEEVASQKDFQLASLLFENLINFKKKSLLTQKREIDNMLLSDVPDFYMEMKWEFESNIIPFVSKFAPSDTFKIWKYGRSVRCDSTFAGIQKYRAKRRAQSLIFNALNLNSKQVNAQTDFDFLTIVHKEEKTFHFPLQELDIEEKKKIMQDLLSSSESIQGNLKIEKTTINPSKSFFGSKTTQKVQGYMCDKYDLQLRYRYMIFKKTRIPFLKNYDRYMSTYTDLSPTKSLVSPQDASYMSDRKNENFQHPMSCQTSMKEIKINGIENGNPFEIQITETNKNEIKKQTLGLYVSEEFPMKFKVFMPLLQFLSNGNSLLMNLYEVFKDPQVNDTIIKKGFPVKVQIPLSYSIYANITFSQYKPLSCIENENITQLFNIPNDSVFMNRKEKQNTMKKQKKRLMLANLYLS